MKIELDASGGLTERDVSLVLHVAMWGMHGTTVMDLLWSEACESDRESILEWFKRREADNRGESDG